MSSERSPSGERDIPSHALHNLLADLNESTQTNRLSHPQLPSWTFPPSTTRDGPSPETLNHSTNNNVLTAQGASNRLQNPAPELDLATSSSTRASASHFLTPNRSIFSPGLPTASVSANTAQASMSAPSHSGSSRPLAALTMPASSGRPRNVEYLAESPSPARRSRAPRAQKAVDDPTTPIGSSHISDRRSTPATVTRLFSAPETLSHEVSRHGSYIRTASGTAYTRASAADPAPLPHHLYQRGLISGRHSDITVTAFGTKYALHRLLLDRAPFFESAFSEPWLEASSNEIALRPEELDSNITQVAFELALKRLYGCSSSAEEDKEAMGLFATACWLEMTELVEASVNALLRQMSPSRLSTMIRLVTGQYYGKAGDRILDAAKAMLCREGWEMPIRYWDGISGEIAREIIGNDGFFVSGEWERWILAKRLLDRKLKQRAVEAGLYDENERTKRGPPKNMNFLAIRFDTVYRKQSTAMANTVPESYDPWLALYTSPDIAALLVLIDEGIHYVHLSFEQLQQIRPMTDVLGLPIVPEKVITDALWMSMDLRQRVQNAKLDDQELGMAEEADEGEEEDNGTSAGDRQDADETAVTNNSKGKQVEQEAYETADEDLESGSWDGNGMPRKFWIPYIDSTHTRGSSYCYQDHTIGGTPSGRPQSRHLSRLSATLEPQDMQWASDFTASNLEQTSGKSNSAEASKPLTYSHYPPFRFSAEFPHPSAIQEKKRIYSRTVWYAGSLWNVYVQKVANTKTPQLGVYLHRAKEEHPTDDPRHGASVDERIGQVEMLLRRNSRAQYRYDSTANDADDDPDTSSGDPDTSYSRDHSSPGETTARAATISNLLMRGDGIMKASQNPRTLMLRDRGRLTLQPGSGVADESSNDSTIDSSAPRKALVPALPPYSDNRPTIKTYFKIYSPSKGGRTLSVYESAPDKFNFSQSWGWKSSTLLVDDEVLDYEEGGVRGNTRNGRLRFMIVIGMLNVLALRSLTSFLLMTSVLLGII